MARITKSHSSEKYVSVDYGKYIELKRKVLSLAEERDNLIVEKDRLRMQLSYAGPTISVKELNIKLDAALQENNRLRKAMQRMSAALSRIDYMCDKPNEMEVSGYDVHCNEQAVVDHVQKVLSTKESNMADRYKAKLICNPSVTGSEKAVGDIQFLRGLTGWGLKEAKQFWDNTFRGCGYKVIDVYLNGDQVARNFTEKDCKEPRGNLYLRELERTESSSTVDMAAPR